jgi:hypothetical protein
MFEAVNDGRIAACLTVAASCRRFCCSSRKICNRLVCEKKNAECQNHDTGQCCLRNSRKLLQAGGEFLYAFANIGSCAIHQRLRLEFASGSARQSSNFRVFFCCQ